MTMAKRPIGWTEICVSEVSFGCASIGNLYREITDEVAQGIVTLMSVVI
jgi:D-threo-aldose 1-dehydrogenase